MPESRLTTSQAAANALVDAKAIDLTAIAKIIGDHATDAMRRGDDLQIVISKHNFLACGWPVNVLEDRLANVVGKDV